MALRTGQPGKFGSFKDKVVFNSAQARSRSAGNFGHLILPRGISVFKEEPASRVGMDFIPYVVKEERHPDRYDDRGLAVPDSLWYKRPYRLHGRIGPERQSFVCPTSVSRKCPICEYRNKLLAQNVEWSDDSVKSTNPQKRDLYYIIPKGHKKFEEKIHIWDISNFLFQRVLDDELNEQPDFGEFPDLNNGLTLRIRFSEESFERNKYASTSRIDFEERDYAYGEEMITDLTPLDEVLLVKDYKEISAAYFEGTEAEDGENEEQEEVESPKVAVMTKPKANGSEKRVVSIARPAQKVEEEPEEEEKPKPAPVAARPIMRRSEPAPAATKPAAPAAKPVAVKPAAKVEVAAGTCPSGYVFGVECDKHSECEECPVWTDCYAAQEAAD